MTIAGILEQIRALQQMSDNDLRRLSDDVFALSRELDRTCEEVLEATYRALCAGVPQDNVIEFLRVGIGATAMKEHRL